MKKVVCFGEILLRLNPKGYGRFVQAGEMEASYAGGEANVAVSLAQWGVDAHYVTKVPTHEIGQSAVNELRRFGVDTRGIVRGGRRLGLYYVEKGASQRPSKVIYDRAGSAIAEAKPGEFDWTALLAGADWFHFTGITPALSDSCAALCMEALQAARRLGVPSSCDLNFRKKLWSREKACQVMTNLMPLVEICVANEEDAADVFDIHAQGTNLRQGRLSPEGYVNVAQQLADRFGFKKVAITLRGSVSASDNQWSGLLYTQGAAAFGPEYPVRIVDRVGGGDSFGAALIYAQLQGWADARAISFAVAASCLKHTIEHDFNLVSLQEIENLAAGDSSGRVQR
jgi:2-dehydro-3-deoxygluconokinase